MQESLSSRFQGIGQSQEKILASYVNAFDGIDVDALAAHLALASVATFLREGLEERVKSLGFDLSRPRYTVVRTLYLARDGMLPKSEIAKAMRVSGAYITQLLRPLEADGWVERLQGQNDRRVAYVRLTDEGIQRCSKLVPGILDYMVESCAVLTKAERDELQSLLGRILGRVGHGAP